MGQHNEKEATAKRHERRIVNLVAREPKTISQLAEALDLSPPSVHTHINDR
jgi:DNA-binding CsgD family transcriptional regulator